MGPLPRFYTLIALICTVSVAANALAQDSGDSADVQTWRHKLVLSCTAACPLRSEEITGHPCRNQDLTNVFCEGAQSGIINGPALVRTDLTPACRSYLAFRAYNQLKLAHSMTEGFGESLTALENHFSNLAFACSQERRASVTAAILSMATEPNESRRYCDTVSRITACSDIGGRQEYVQNQMVCVAANVVIDPSCLVQNERQRRGIVSALTGIQSRGISCLRGLDDHGTQGTQGAGGGTALATRLEAHFRSTPKTQLCCGNRCRFPIFPDRRNVVSELAFADTVGIRGEPSGTIRIFPRALNSEQDVLEPILFHEFLHRIGACQYATHDMSNRQWTDAITAAQAQRLGPSQAATDCNLPAGMTLPPRTHLGTYQSSDGPRCCIARCQTPQRVSSCIHNRLDFVRDDSIYACQRACYGMPYQLPTDADTCRSGGAFADENGFRGLLFEPHCQ